MTDKIVRLLVSRSMLNTNQEVSLIQIVVFLHIHFDKNS